MLSALKNIAARSGFRISRQSTFNNLLKAAQENQVRKTQLKYLSFLQTRTNRETLEELLLHSKSQIAQDVQAAIESGLKRGGYFVEFGGCDGIQGSNTFLLETRLGWSGIIAEPAKSWHPMLRQSRGCRIDTRCVWKETGKEIAFKEESSLFYSGISSDDHSSYRVPTVSLNDLLTDHGAPFEIDYLSMDTEGSELEILSAFDFSKHRIKFITCEHNQGSTKAHIRLLLESQGYERLAIPFEFEDWFRLGTL